MTLVPPGLTVYQVNLQRHFGGGEVYTASLCRALALLGIPSQLLVHPEATFWHELDLPSSTRLVSMVSWDEYERQLPNARCWVLVHVGMPDDIALKLRQRHFVSVMAHMPPHGRGHRYRHFDLVFGVSKYVVQGLRDIGAPHWEEPLYGVAEVGKRGEDAPVRQASRYEWDRRKGRDRLLGWLEPWVEPLRTRPIFVRQPGIILGIVSRLTPIKQFPALFSHLAPLLAQRHEFHLEIFGSGGHASVTDLQKALRPLGRRVRWWGYQRNVAAVYRQLDYLMTGLPEKEALGLNVIEAQAAGVPVLAVDAPPFDETVIQGVTGLCYRDPRQDGGEDFARVLDQLRNVPFKLDEKAAQSHLAQFTVQALSERLARFIESGMLFA